MSVRSAWTWVDAWLAVYVVKPQSTATMYKNFVSYAAPEPMGGADSRPELLAKYHALLRRWNLTLVTPEVPASAAAAGGAGAGAGVVTAAVGGAGVGGAGAVRDVYPAQIVTAGSGRPQPLQTQHEDDYDSEGELAGTTYYSHRLGSSSGGGGGGGDGRTADDDMHIGNMKDFDHDQDMDDVAPGRVQFGPQLPQPNLERAIVPVHNSDDEPGVADGPAWDCAMCTYHNAGHLFMCEMCSNSKVA